MTSYIVPSSSAISVLFSISEDDDSDRSLMQVFLLEFSEAKRTVPGSPIVLFSRDEPTDIAGIRLGEKPSVGYLLFCMFTSIIMSTITNSFQPEPCIWKQARQCM